MRGGGASRRCRQEDALNEHDDHAHQHVPEDRAGGIRGIAAAADAASATAHARSAAAAAAAAAPDAAHAPVGHGAAVPDVVVLVECVA